MPTLLYLHGFLSSPTSHKASLTKQWLPKNYPHWQYLCPALSSYPKVALADLQSLSSTLDPETTFVIGSSLGGYWATYLVETGLARAAVLVNPAVAPQDRFHEFLDRPLASYYTDEVFTLGARDLETLVACDHKSITRPESYWLLLQKGDETLDYRLAAARYGQCRQLLEEGGSHTFDGFDTQLPAIMAFFESFERPVCVNT